MNGKPAVVLVIFNRPEKTRLVLERILQAQPTKLYVVADGPRADNPEDQALVAQTRSWIDAASNQVEVIRIYADANLGLRQRFLTGLDEVFSFESSAIVVEDDCLPSESFFRFASELLSRYSRTQLGVVAGSNFGPYKARRSSYHLSRSPYIWGWATWADVWQRFRAEEEREAWKHEEYEAVLKTFSTRGQAKDFESMMRAAHKLNTWDISFAVWLRQHGLLTAVPARNLVQNIGFGDGATHTIFENFDVNLPAEELDFPLLHPTSLEPDIAREKRMWFRKRSRWVTFPLFHPLDFLGRLIRYLKNTTK